MFFDEQTGALSFENSVRLTAHMPRGELLAALKEAGGTSPDLGESGVIPFPPCPVAGGLLAPICYLWEDRLWAIALTVTAIGSKTTLSAEQQRAFLFSLFSAKDPCPDILRNCALRCGFGVLTFCTDPRGGHALGRLTYSSIE